MAGTEVQAGGKEEQSNLGTGEGACVGGKLPHLDGGGGYMWVFIGQNSELYTKNGRGGEGEALTVCKL